MSTPDFIPCADGGPEHKRVMQDEFAKLPGVKRATPGDCYCLDCKQPLPAWWNGGKITPVTACKEKG